MHILQVYFLKNQFPCKCFCTHLSLGDLPCLRTDDCGPQSPLTVLITVQSEEASFSPVSAWATMLYDAGGQFLVVFLRNIF